MSTLGTRALLATVLALGAPWSPLPAQQPADYQAAVDAALERLRTEAADPEVNLMPTLIHAVEQYATLGEVMNALADVFGRHTEVPTI